jgi:hypothetical protein
MRLKQTNFSILKGMKKLESNIDDYFSICQITSNVFNKQMFSLLEDLLDKIE